MTTRRFWLLDDDGELLAEGQWAPLEVTQTSVTLDLSTVRFSRRVPASHMRIDLDGMMLDYDFGDYWIKPPVPLSEAKQIGPATITFLTESGSEGMGQLAAEGTTRFPIEGELSTATIEKVLESIRGECAKETT